MWIFVFNEICADSIVIAMLIVLVRYKTVATHFFPFAVFVFISFLNEVLSTILVAAIRSNVVNSNIYKLIEYLVLLWLFNRWKGKHAHRNIHIVLGIIGTAIWIADNLVLHSLKTFNSIFCIWHDLVLVVLSVNQINLLVVTERKSLLKNPVFLICIAVLIFYSYQAVLETFYLIQSKKKSALGWYLLTIFNCINLLGNLLYARAASLINKKQKFSLRYI